MEGKTGRGFNKCPPPGYTVSGRGFNKCPPPGYRIQAGDLINAHHQGAYYRQGI